MCACVCTSVCMWMHIYVRVCVLIRLFQLAVKRDKCFHWVMERIGNKEAWVTSTQVVKEVAGKMVSHSGHNSLLPLHVLTVPAFWWVLCDPHLLPGAVSVHLCCCVALLPHRPLPLTGSVLSHLRAPLPFRRALQPELSSACRLTLAERPRWEGHCIHGLKRF